MTSPRIHITGASGSGVTTTGQQLASRLHIPLIDTDDIFWLPTDPPYQSKRARSDRAGVLDRQLDDACGWVLAGSLDGWGDFLIPRFDLVVFLHVPTQIRVERLRKRERHRFGAALDPGGAMHDQHRDFLEWAAGYEFGDHQSGRSLQRHRDWMTRLACPVLALDGNVETEQIIGRILAGLRAT